jgi:putative FmdB family regulatory protein
MPIYEYRCGNCGRKVAIWWRSQAQLERSHPTCSRCGSDQLKRIVSRTAFLRSEESRLDNLADSGLGDLDENDPKSMGRWMRRMSQEVGEDMGPEFDEMVGRLEAGESPEQIEQSMPGLADEAAGMDGGLESGDLYDV